jgi:hypothetical protein
MKRTVVSFVLPIPLLALLLLSAPGTAALAASNCEPLPCGTTLRVWDPENRLHQYSIIHVTNVWPKTASYPDVPCGEPMGPPETHKIVTYRDWEGGCPNAGSEVHTLYGNVCFGDMRWWPSCCATLIVQAEGSGDCMRLDFLDNCECPHPK